MLPSQRFMEDVLPWLDGFGGDVLPWLEGQLIERWLKGSPKIFSSSVAGDILQRTRWAKVAQPPQAAELRKILDDYEYRVVEADTNRFVTPRVLSQIFECIKKGRRSSGTFFTSPGVAQFMAAQLLDGAGPRPERSLMSAIDPACGGGALLVALLQGWLQRRRANGLLNNEVIRELVATRLCGVDRDQGAVHICRLRIWLTALAHSPAPAELIDLQPNIVVGDALATRPTSRGNDWRKWFPLLSVEGGFRYVIANPPYVRVERIENREQLADFPEVASRRADLYHRFYVLALELLQEEGSAAVITSNSWLDANSGAPLQQYLLQHSHLVSVTEPRRIRAFAGADINAAITVMRKQSELSRSDVTRFESLDDRWRVDVGTQRVRARTRQQLVETLGDPARPKSGKWGGRFLRAPDVYDWLVEANPNLRPLKRAAEILGYIHDNDTGKDYPPVPFVKSVRGLHCVDLGREEGAIGLYGVKESTAARRVAPILFPRTFGTRHLVAWNSAQVFGKEFYKVIPCESRLNKLICAQLNSTWGILQREILGVSNLGEGGLKFSRYDLGEFQVLTEFGDRADELEAAFVPFSRRSQLDLPAELDQEDRRQLDSVILESLGLPEERWDELYREVASLVESRRTRGQWSRS